ncbi:hypothetical protein AaE_015737 [Aphanomyces astaci]|uniref:Uncharacterized protein n=2 Tax=Aphanomyces astaci TaxID=112090 RepID=A0A6A4Z088_APHAT|nr:hypothetical protein AaE_015737 [Aphanomyces astaci]
MLAYLCEKANGDLRTIVKGRVQDSDDGNTENQGIEEAETADTAQPSPRPAPTAASKKPTRKRPRSELVPTKVILVNSSLVLQNSLTINLALLLNSFFRHL